MFCHGILHTMNTIRKISTKHILITVATLILLVLLYVYINTEFFSMDSYQFYAWIDELGWTGPIVIISLMIAEVILAPLPGGWLAIANGYIFGPWAGFLYSYIGNFIGSVIAFELARHIGQPYARHMIKEDRFKAYSEKLKNAHWGLFLLYAIPLFPIDIIGIILGLTNITRKRFLLVMGIGFIPNMFVLNFVGSAISSPEYQYALLGLTVAAMLYFIVNWFNIKLFNVKADSSTK